MLAFARLIGNREINVMLNMIVLLRDPGSIPLSFIVWMRIDGDGYLGLI